MKKPFKGFRLNVTTITLTAFLIISCFLSYFLSQDMQRSYDHKVELTFNGNRFMAASTYLTNEVRAYASTGNEVHYHNYWNEVNQNENRDIALARMTEIGIIEEEKKIIEKMSNLSNSLIPMESKAMDDVKAGDLESAMAYVYGEDYNRDVGEINALKEEFLATLDSRTSIAAAEITMKSNVLQITLCIYALLIIIMQIISYVKNKAMLDEFERLATVDLFSGLYNRNKYMQTVEKIMTEKTDAIGIVYLDINGLKQVNDEYGHEYGDRHILKIVGIMKECFIDHLFRIGGDEFVALDLRGDRTSFEEKVLQLRNAMSIQDDTSVSIGSTWCADTSDIFKYISHADELMYIDKQNYNTNLKLNRKTYRSSTAAALCAAISAGEFIILLQPKVRLSDEKVVGAEALVRKIDQQGKFISPDKFISIYESDGIIQYLDYFVLELACKTLRNWHESGQQLLPISVNFSRITILEYKVAEKISVICKAHNIEPKYITIELTEHIGNILIEKLKEIINEVRSFGFKVSLDDFGREYSNLEVLAHVPFDEIKIDKNLIDDITIKPEICTAMQHLVGMCNSFRPTEMVIEGIETYEQLTILRESVCGLDVGQGFYFSKPILVDDFLQYCTK